MVGSADPGAPNQEAFYNATSDSAELGIIEGGNHRRYADYSFQKDDRITTISADDQQNSIIAATIQFFNKLK